MRCTGKPRQCTLISLCCKAKNGGFCRVLHLQPANKDLRCGAPLHALAKRAHGNAAEASFDKKIVSVFVPHLQVLPPSVTRRGRGFRQAQARGKRVGMGCRSLYVRTCYSVDQLHANG